MTTVSDSNLPPEQWRPLFDKIGVAFGYRPLANKIGMDHTRLRRLMRGGGTSAAAVQDVADAFGVSPETIRELRGEGGEVVEPFTLPDDAGRLTHDERDVIRAMVRALLDARDRTDERRSDSDHPPTEEPRASGAEDQKTRKPTSLSDRRSRRQAGPDALPEERPEDAWAARKRDPRFKPDIPSSDNIGEESQDPDDHDEK